MNKRKVAFCAIAFLVVLFISPFFFYSNKNVHVSIDDVISCLSEIENDSMSYNSLFDHHFFSDLLLLHNVSGCKFSLYIFEKSDCFTINKFPSRYKDDFIENRDWLKLGYHGLSNETTRDSILSYDCFVSSFNNFSSQLYRITGSNGCNILRLHYYEATKDEVVFLKNAGVKCLLASDDDRLNYSLAFEEKKKLLLDENYSNNLMQYEITDIRIENSNPIIELYKNCNDETIVLFTHEWALNSIKTRLKFWFIVLFLTIYNCNFIID